MAQRNHGRVLPSIPWHPRVFYADDTDTERISKSYRLFVLLIGIVYIELDYRSTSKTTMRTYFTVVVGCSSSMLPSRQWLLKYID